MVLATSSLPVPLSPWVRIDYLPDDLVNLLHRRAAADHADAGLKSLFDLLLELAKVPAHLAALQGPPHQDEDLFQIEGLGDVVKGAVFHRLDGVAHGALGRHEDHGGI